MITRQLARLALQFLLLTVAAAHAAPTEPSVRDLLDRPGLVQLPDDPDELFDANAVRRFYTRRGFQPAWTGPGCQAALQQLIGAIEDSESHGLSARDYHMDGLLGSGRCDATRELLATDAWLALAAHLHAGRVNPLTVEPDWTATRPTIDAVALLEQTLAAGDVAGALERLAPHDPLYAALREALARYRSYAARGGWVGIAPGPSLRRGDSGTRVGQLRARLQLSGLLEVEPETGIDTRFDDTVEDAVRRFQRRTNLEPDGVVGAQTLIQLNRRASHRIEQARANLERLRWLPEDMGRRHIRVNIADYRLEAWADGVLERVHQVIVGRQYRSTPSFSGQITRLVFSPWWEVPRSLAVKDKLPLFRRDPGALDRLGYVVIDRNGGVVDPAGIDWKTLSANNFPYRLRQRPGPKNALGVVKFLFPNAHDVYLHDTSEPALFSHARRSFSSGCIRVESALELARWVLAPMPEWTRERIDAAATAGVEQVVELREPVPVHLLYLTAVSDGNGGVRFIDDVYDRDPALITALDRAPPVVAP
ncbi:L,D-transpeptidase family protein [Dokdonella immobilis]|uniref:Murein L,D-transpeptidase YcbB/YkuD n=1 Tax=Dokdonella immobilis TaxID=578942 RepID=A0A1I5A7F2_9GAMM|nr:L,D-transpeptidase family protein [Dokdonella immobilis]SFN58328.1 Murein L,D-transpeptidase YcbB/YkuD [Dokdonella immobilis]